MRHRDPRHPHDSVVRIDHERHPIALGIAALSGRRARPAAYDVPGAPNGRNRSPGRRLRTDNGSRTAPARMAAFAGPSRLQSPSSAEAARSSIATPASGSTTMPGTSSRRRGPGRLDRRPAPPSRRLGEAQSVPAFLGDQARQVACPSGLSAGGQPANSLEMPRRQRGAWRHVCGQRADQPPRQRRRHQAECGGIKFNPPARRDLSG